MSSFITEKLNTYFTNILQIFTLGDNDANNSLTLSIIPL